MSSLFPATCEEKLGNVMVIHRCLFSIFTDPFYLSTSRSTASTEASVGAVIGAVVTVLVLLVLNAFLVLFCIKRKTGNKSSSASLSSSSGKTTAASTSEGKNHIKIGAGGFFSSLLFSWFSLPSHLNFSLICQNVCFFRRQFDSLYQISHHRDVRRQQHGLQRHHVWRNYELNLRKEWKLHQRRTSSPPCQRWRSRWRPSPQASPRASAAAASTSHANNRV